MITLKTLEFSNVFSYGKDNVIKLDQSPITQLIGKNGHGKSSIAEILSEGLFNKNSKGIKKGDILNRYIQDKSYSISIEFNKDEDNYQVIVTRGTSQTVVLFKNGDNISAHTATATFKLIEDILGFDHKTFSQLVYQSSASSLEFLTATDTARKKFLIDLLNLTKYTEAFEVFKQQSKKVSEDILKLEAKIDSTQHWIDTNLKEDLVPLSLEEYPEYNDNPSKELALVEKELSSIKDINSKITKNNLYKEQLSQIPLDIITQHVPTIESDKPIHAEIGAKEATIRYANTLISKISNLSGVCPTCMQPVDLELLTKLVDEQEEIKKQAQESINRLNTKLEEIGQLTKQSLKILKLKTEWENYHALIDPALSEDVLNAEDLVKRIQELNTEIQKRQACLAKIEKHNSMATAKNARIDVIKSQMKEMQDSLDVYTGELDLVSKRLSILQLLQKTFSTNGLIAYKIEILVKDLEILTNQYLAELSGGRFQISFKVTSGDKLSVIVTDNGIDIDILTLSHGELARVNTATLLAIRKLMQSLSSARINLLFLDETIENLDLDGKEKLIDVLLQEDHLNTFLVSHGYSHPLLEKITVIKENHISRLE